MPLISSGIDTTWFGDGSSGNVYLTKWANLGTVAALPAYTVGPPGTLTGNANGQLAVDGSGIGSSTKVLVKNETGSLAVNNGVYDVVQTGDAGTPYILTRSADFDDSIIDSIKQGTCVHVNAGNANDDTVWRLENKLIEALLGSTANVGIGPGVLPVVDGFQVKEGDIVFLKDQLDDKENGVWLASSSGWTRIPELNADTDFNNNIHVYVDRGTTNGATYWRCDQLTVTLGVTSITFSSSLDAVTINLDRLSFLNLITTTLDQTDGYFNNFIIETPSAFVGTRTINLRGTRIFCKSKFSVVCNNTTNVTLFNGGQTGQSTPAGGAGGLGITIGGGTAGAPGVLASDGDDAADQPVTGGFTSALGRGGGDGGDASGFNGGNGGTAVLSSQLALYNSVPVIWRGYVDTLSGTAPFFGGAGGGSGGSNGLSDVSGAGGGGGGIVWIAAAEMRIDIDVGSTLMFSAQGGNGGISPDSNCGGGGGGGGGSIILLHGGMIREGEGLMILNADGGNGGNGVGPGAGNFGGTGGAGGRTFLYNIARGFLIEELGATGTTGLADT